MAQSNIVNEKQKKMGAGGYWKTIGEKKDSLVVRQITTTSCVSAVGEMILKERGFSVTQKQILATIGEYSTTVALARFLNEIDKPIDNEKWHGIIVEAEDFHAILKKGIFGAVFHEGKPLGHLVLVDGLDNKGRVRIKDPWDGTSYKMEEAEFLRVWSGELIFRWKL